MLLQKLFPKPKDMRIIVLGYSDVGKTYYIGSLFRLRMDLGAHGLSIRHKDLLSKGRVEDIYDVISKNKEGYIGTDVTKKDIELVFQQGINDAFNLVLTDIVGQSVEPGRNVDLGHQLLQTLPDYDGILLFIKAPKDKDELEKSKYELAQLLDISNVLLKKKKNVPLGLILTQIDKLSSLQGIKAKIDKRVDIVKESILLKEGKNYVLVDEHPDVKKEKKQIIDYNVKEAMLSQEIIEITTFFERKIKHSNSKIAFRIFPTTSFGFDNAEENAIDKHTQVAKSLLCPYGTIVSFLWMLYIIKKEKEKEYPSLYALILRLLNSEKKSIKDKILEEIDEQYNNGMAYSDVNSPIWNIGKLKDLY